MTDYLSRKIKIVSFLAIVCVMMQHAINFTGYIDPSSTYFGKLTVNTGIQYFIGYGFSRIAVALFFMLSGYLFFRNFTFWNTLSKWKSRVTSLCIPYVLWGILSLLVVILLQLIPMTRPYVISLYTGNLIGHSLGFYLQSIVHHGVAFQLWFLSDLMLYTLLAPLFYIILKYTSIVTIIPLYIMWILQIPLPPMLSFLYRGGIFYLLGAYIAMYAVYIPSDKQKNIALTAVLSWIFILAVKLSVAFGILPSQWIHLAQLDNMAMLMGITAVWFGYDVISSRRIVSWIEQLTPYTFFIYASHEPLLEMMKRVGFDIVGYSSVAPTILYISTIASTGLITVVLAFMTKKYFPKLYSLLTGGR